MNWGELMPLFRIDKTCEESMSNFQKMKLPDSLKKSLNQMKFHHPTPIQEATLNMALSNKDIIACAETGSGKTAAYSIPLVTNLIENNKCNALILCPTRELAQQTASVMRELTSHSKKITLSTLVGGMDIKKQLKSVNKKPRILIATPGRLIDHIERKSVSLAQTTLLVLDEGDRMLDMGFAPQLNQILRHLPQKRQTMLFTATLTKKVKSLAEKYLYKPESISVGQESQPVSTIKQEMIFTSPEDKNELLLDQLVARDGSVIIFTKTQNRTDWLTTYLKEYGHQVAAIHGGLTQGKRNNALTGFRSGKYRILCATDVAARGIDIPHVQHVINYDLPLVDEDYVHRIGRTARNGATGQALSLVTASEARTWTYISRKFNVKVDDSVKKEMAMAANKLQLSENSSARPQARRKKSNSRGRSKFKSRSAKRH